MIFGQTYNHAISCCNTSGVECGNRESDTYIYTENCSVTVTLESTNKDKKRWAEFRADDHCNEAIDWKLSRLATLRVCDSISQSPYPSSDNRDAIFADFCHSACQGICCTVKHDRYFRAVSMPGGVVQLGIIDSSYCVGNSFDSEDTVFVWHPLAISSVLIEESDFHSLFPSCWSDLMPTVCESEGLPVSGMPIFG
jgi:hypothetical protein